MKKLIYFLFIPLLLLQGCSSDSDNNDNNNNGSSTILCKSIRYNESDATNIRNYRDEYIYVGNKLFEMKSYYNDVLVGPPDVVFYTGDLITEIKFYDELNRLDGNTVCTYNNSGQLIESIYYDKGILDVKDTYTYNQNGTITQLTYYNYNKQETLKSNSTLTYTNGDLVKIDVIEYDGAQVYNNYTITYLYDDKNSPFKNVHSSFKKILIGLDEFGLPSGNNHNVIKKTVINSNPNILNSTKNYQYIYNSDNYPTKQTSSNSGSSIVEYTY